MNIDLIPIGDDPPNSLNVIIEVPVGGEPVKYEFDKKSGALFVDRILHTPMRYPANYGFVPHTLSPDGDPLDALVVARSPFVPGCVVRVRPIAVLKLEDEAGRCDVPLLQQDRREGRPARDRHAADRAFLHALQRP
jgi:inorganic pyrophosphatase